MVDLTGLTHYPEGYGIIVARGDIDMGWRWRAGMISRQGAGYVVNGERDFGFNQRKGVSVMARDLSGLPILSDLCADDIWTRLKGVRSF